MKTITLLYYLIILLLLLSPAVNAQNVEKELDLYLERYYQNKNVPSVSAGALYKGKIIWLKTLGYADIENSVPANIKTVYRIASVSKSITSVAVMQLVEQGKINLNDDVRKYLPWFPAKKWGFTIRHLLSHTSGIRNYRLNEFDNKEFFKSTRDAIEYIAKDSLDFEPGTNYSYSTLGYNLLAGVIESVSRLSYREYLRRNIFLPSGMTSTYPEYQSEIVLNRAHGYNRNNFRQLMNAPLTDLSLKFAGGGLISTSEDLLKFASALLSNKLIKKESFDTLLVPVKLKSGKVINYSLGFTTGIGSQKRKYITHTGAGTGFVSQLLIYPDEKLATVHLINIRDRNLDNPCYEIGRIILDKAKIVSKISTADKMMESYLSSGLDSALVVYNKLKSDSSDYYYFSPEEAAFFGTDLTASGRFTDAIKYYKFVLTDYPENSKIYSGLADAYLRDGNNGLALKNFRTAVSLDANNKYASDMIEKIK